MGGGGGGEGARFGEGWCWILPPGRSLLKDPLGTAGPASPWSWPVCHPEVLLIHSWPRLSPSKGSSRPHAGIILDTWGAHKLKRSSPRRDGSHVVPPASLLLPSLFSSLPLPGLPGPCSAALGKGQAHPQPHGFTDTEVGLPLCSAGLWGSTDA